jgi:hypothetical protein
MKQCPFCMGQIPDAAVKCQHCGEWVERRPMGGDQQMLLSDVANKFINYKIITGVVGLIVFLIFFLLFWLPTFNRVQSGFPSSGGQPPTIQITHP